MPGPLARSYSAPRDPVRLVPVLAPDESFDSPFELLGGRSFQRMTVEVLYRLFAVMAFSPRSTGTWPAFLTCHSRDEELDRDLVAHVANLPTSTMMWVSFGTGMSAVPAPGMRGVRLADDDPLADERFFIMLSDQAPVGVFARRSSDGLYDVVVTQSRDLVRGIAHQLIRRMPAPGPANAALPVQPSGGGSADVRIGDAEATESPTGKRGWRRRA